MRDYEPTWLRCGWQDSNADKPKNSNQLTYSHVPCIMDIIRPQGILWCSLSCKQCSQVSNMSVFSLGQDRGQFRPFGPGRCQVAVCPDLYMGRSARPYSCPSLCFIFEFHEHWVTVVKCGTFLFEWKEPLAPLFCIKFRYQSRNASRDIWSWFSAPWPYCNSLTYMWLPPLYSMAGGLHVTAVLTQDGS